MTSFRVSHGIVGNDATGGSWPNAFMTFIRWSQGHEPLDAALQAIAEHFGADAACIARREPGLRNSRLVKIHDPCADPRRPQLSQSFAADILGDTIDHIRPGAVLTMADAEEVLNVPQRLETWVVRRGITDIGIICLGSKNRVHDVLELHFSGGLTPVWRKHAAEIGALLAGVFDGRVPGSIQLSLLRQDGASADDIMAPENPLGLTPSEWRLCVLIASGLSREGATKELGVTKNTVRTHLRNIYAKTGIQTFHDLALRLVSSVSQRRVMALAGMSAA